MTFLEKPPTGEPENQKNLQVSDILSDISSVAQGCGAVDFVISLDSTIAGDCNFFRPSHPEKVPPHLLNSHLAELQSDLRQGVLWNDVSFKNKPYLLVGASIELGDEPSQCLVGMAFDPSTTNSDIAKKAVANIQIMSARILKMWAEQLRLELEVNNEKRRGDHFQRISERDHLTGLQNVAAFKKGAEEILANKETMSAVILLDVDNFKTVNDVFGHGFGDRYLTQIAMSLERSLPKGSLVGRVGGDEFAAVVKAPQYQQFPMDQLDQTAEAWMAAFCRDVMVRCAFQIQRAVALLGKADLGGLSMGASIAPIHAEKIERLPELSDAALYFNKAKLGTAMPSVFDASKHDAYSNRLLKSRFDTAIKNRQIIPYFQPIVSLRDNKVVGFEALARWQDPKRGLLIPGEFNQVFKDPQMAQELTRAILHSSLSYLARFRARSVSSDQFLTINLSKFDLVDAEFICHLEMMLQVANLPWDALVIEITEEVMLGSKTGIVFQNISEMRDRGARIALDDFGTGYGGLQHLKNWPVDILKVDRSFVLDMDEDRNSGAIVRAILDIAENSNLEVIVEGIESEKIEGLIRDLKAAYVQGYFYARAVPPRRLLAAMSCSTDSTVLEEFTKTTRDLEIFHPGFSRYC